MDREQRIASLAATLKSSGLAKSDSQARMMAEEMIGVEDHVQKKFDEEHSKAQEFLKTAKNLGTPVQPRPSAASQTPAPATPSSASSQASISSTNSTSVRSLSTQPSASSKSAAQTSAQVSVSTSSPSTSPHNDESLFLHGTPRAESQKPVNSGLSSLMLSQIQEEKQEIETVDTLVERRDKQMEGSFARHSLPPVQSVETQSARATPIESTPDSVPPAFSSSSSSARSSAPEMVSSISETPAAETPAAEKIPEESTAADTALDTRKLVELMEEDGKLEEHSREIKEKPKDVKPKESYVENTVDLSSMFDFNKK